MAERSSGTGGIALITGASRGIGRAITLALAREGFDCVINYARNSAAAEEVKGLVEAAGMRTHLVQADIGSREDRQRLVDESTRAFGRIDLLVNNAGVAPDVRADILDASEESFDRLIGINLKGPYFLTQLVARRMIEQQKDSGVRVQGSGKGGQGSEVSDQEEHSARAPSPLGGEGRVRGNATTSNEPDIVEQSAIRNPQSALSSLNPEPRILDPLPLTTPPHPKIITISSISAFTASTNRGDYCVAKAGLSMMTQLYAARLAEYGINVYEIRPGVIATDMTGPVKAKYDKLILEDGLTPIRRWGEGDDVAKAVVAIAKDLLPYSTGEVINVDGGFHLRRL